MKIFLHIHDGESGPKVFEDVTDFTHCSTGDLYIARFGSEPIEVRAKEYDFYGVIE